MKNVSIRTSKDKLRKIISIKKGTKFEEAFRLSDDKTKADFFAVLMHNCKTKAHTWLLDFDIREEFEETSLAAINKWTQGLGNDIYLQYRKEFDVLLETRFEDAADILKSVKDFHDRIDAMQTKKKHKP